MKRFRSVSFSSTKRNGVAVVYTAVLMLVLIGFAALTVDVGALYNTRIDLQDAADSAAMAAASAYSTDTMLRVRFGDDLTAAYELRSEARQRADDFALRNPTLARNATLLEEGDVRLGCLDLNSGTSTLDSSCPEENYNAVEVVVRRSLKSSNGPVALWFANVFGKGHTDIVATATAAYDNRIAGVDPRRVPPLLPFTVRASYFDANLDSGPDAYAYDDETEAVTVAADSIPEMKLYPHPSAGGNFGALNIGISSQGASKIENQIREGVAPEELITEIGTSVLSFVDESGDPMNYPMTGNTGLSASMENAVSQRVGDIVGFFLHDSVADDGSNTTYQITRVVYGRLMAVNLQTGSTLRGIWIQPIAYDGDGVITSPTAPPAYGLLGKIVLAR